mmetsp:Transcript_55612/g.166662  ORF Transcript_55612/g.166662 Transcript_55612/m.166662 type:complete len:122 (+) Transcript_55612:293-658(+)
MNASNDLIWAKTTCVTLPVSTSAPLQRPLKDEDYLISHAQIVRHERLNNEVEVVSILAHIEEARFPTAPVRRLAKDVPNLLPVRSVLRHDDLARRGVGLGAEAKGEVVPDDDELAVLENGG